ncbi:MAG TPA: PilZ domain-containing protein [Candidatus Xenobia bacterium]|nr:PilZ domain-containing protein [Candidatus Xenobia bacterium]
MAATPIPRRYQRVKLTPAKWVIVQSAGRTDTLRCTTMGLGGMFLECAEPFPEGAFVRFAFSVGAQTARGTATVRDATDKGIGLAFVTLKPDDRAKIRRFLERQLARK